jgi:hypothetical protein
LCSTSSVLNKCAFVCIFHRYLYNKHSFLLPQVYSLSLIPKTRPTSPFSLQISWFSMKWNEGQVQASHVDNITNLFVHCPLCTIKSYNFVLNYFIIHFSSFTYYPYLCLNNISLKRVCQNDQTYRYMYRFVRYLSTFFYTYLPINNHFQLITITNVSFVTSPSSHLATPVVSFLRSQNP